MGTSEGQGGGFGRDNGERQRRRLSGDARERARGGGEALGERERVEGECVALEAVSSSELERRRWPSACPRSPPSCFMCWHREEDGSAPGGLGRKAGPTGKARSVLSHSLSY